MESRPRILIVDDEADARDMLEALLFREGYELSLAGSGPEALAMARELAPDAILLDVMMPGMDGFEVCRQLRADPDRGEVPILLVTALDDRGARIRGIEAGADDFVSKPVDRLELRARVRTITRLNRYRRLLWERTKRQEAEEEILRRNQELMLLNRVITTVASTFNEEEILSQACAALAEAFDMPQATAALYAADQAQASPIVHYPKRNIQQQQPTASFFGPILLRDSISKSPLPILNAPSDPRLADAHPQLGEQGILSMLVVPILMQDKIIGSIELHTHEPKQFVDSDLTLATSVAIAVGQGLERSHLYGELQRHAQSLEETVAKRTLELQTERDRTQAILEALGEAVIVVDAEGKIRYANPAAVTLTGFPSEGLIAQAWNLWQRDPMAAEFNTQAQEAARSGDRWSGETVYRRKDGSLYHAAVTVAPLFEPCQQPELAGFVSVHRDVTQITEAERLKDEFISNVSHELRTPLSVVTLVSGNLDTLYDRLTAGKRQQMVRDIRAHIRVLNDVVEDVLELSRIDSHAISMEREPINVAELTREEVKKQLPLAQRKAQEVLVSGADELPVWGNKSQLRQVIRNLLNNAIKYTPNSGLIHCELLVVEEQAETKDTLSAGSEGRLTRKQAALRIRDNGIGVSAQDLPHLFERFYRVAAQGDVPGTGLGLAIAKELVTLHNGHLTVVSTPDQGSTFTVLLPLFGEQMG